MQQMCTTVVGIRSPSHLNVRLMFYIKFEVVCVDTTAFTILNDVLTLTDGPVLVGIVVVIYRQTPIEAQVDWLTAKFTSPNLQTEEQHMITVQQELYDYSTRIIKTTLIE